MVADRPERRYGPELGEDLVSLWEVRQDLPVRWPGDAVVRPDGEATAERGREDDSRGTIAEFVVGGLAAEKQVDDLAEVPLRDLHGQVGGEATEAGLAGEAAPERLGGRELADGEREWFVFSGSALEFLADLDDGAGADDGTRIGGGGGDASSERFDHYDLAGEALEAGSLGVFVAAGIESGEDADRSGCYNGYCAKDKVEVPYLEGLLLRALSTLSNMGVREFTY